MAQINHACMTKNSNGTKKIIGHGEKCLAPTGKCFWKDAEHIKSCDLKTRGHTKKEPTVSNQAYRNYFEHKERIGQWILCTKSQTMKKEDHFYVLLLFCFYMMLFIVNNGNILTDGRNERKYFHRKYNEL